MRCPATAVFRLPMRRCCPRHDRPRHRLLAVWPSASSCHPVIEYIGCAGSVVGTGRANGDAIRQHGNGSTKPITVHTCACAQLFLQLPASTAVHVYIDGTTALVRSTNDQGIGKYGDRRAEQITTGQIVGLHQDGCQAGLTNAFDTVGTSRAIIRAGRAGHDMNSVAGQCKRQIGTGFGRRLQQRLGMRAETRERPCKRANQNLQTDVFAHAFSRRTWFGSACN